MKRAKTLSWAPRYTIYDDDSIEGPRGLLVGDWSNGYWRVLLHLPDGRRHCYVHRLVCEAFHGSAPSAEHHAAHLDGDRRNCAADNLCWATAEENEAHKVVHDRVSKGERNGFTDLTTELVQRMRNDRATGLSFRKLADAYGVSKSTAFNVCSGNTWGHVA